ncbi:MAG: hypothetical protein FD123_3168 [Bacteroidetes bacterium]|nr:MAG: hypothetical protein FD123_3168 [Bacteroidota bacterium]
MKTIEIKNRNILKTPQGYQFIPIGNPDKLFGQGGLLDQVADRIFRRNKAQLEDFWATIGRQDGQAIDWSGQLVCSGKGNERSTGITGQEVDIVRAIYPGIAASNTKVIEKVIAFDQVKFGTSPGSRKIRMTIMLKENESALFFLQHTEQSDAMSQSGMPEYILPQDETDTGKRDRLTYFFSVPEISANAQAGAQGTRFIVKVLTFQRDNSKVDDILRPLDTEYGFLVYNPQSNAFEQIVNPVAGIDPAKKTLLLLHGTFSYTEKSYGNLRLPVEANGKTWLQTVLDSGKYQQIIGFDHPTVFESPLDNAGQLYLRLQGKKFMQHVDIITTSRGGLVGKSVINNQQIHQDRFQVERAATVACANGVGYFDTAENISRFLSVARAVAGETTAKLIIGLAHQAVDYIRKQPGLDAMKPNSPVLNQILGTLPANQQMRYMPVCGDFKPAADASAVQRSLDWLISKMLSTENDWVVGTNEQAIMPPGYYAYGKNHDYYYGLAVNSRHLDYFNPEVTSTPKQRIYEFLHQEYDAIK